MACTQELPDGFQRPKPGRPIHPDGKLSAAVTARRPGDQETPFFAPKPETLLATLAPGQHLAGALHIVEGNLPEPLRYVLGESPASRRQQFVRRRRKLLKFLNSIAFCILQKANRMDWSAQPNPHRAGSQTP